MPPLTAADWKVAVHPDATTLSPTRTEVVAFDLEGRPTSWFRDGRTFKRSLASDVLGRRTVDGVRQRWHVPTDDAHAKFARAHEVAGAARDALHAGSLQPTAAVALARPSATEAGAAPASDEVLAELDDRLRRSLAWTPARLAAERDRFAAAYAPIPILPPDQYGAVVLQATFGCSWNRCTYCSFYQDRPFQVRPPEAFAAHVEAVRVAARPRRRRPPQRLPRRRQRARAGERALATALRGGAPTSSRTAPSPASSTSSAASARGSTTGASCAPWGSSASRSASRPATTRCSAG